MTRCCLRIGSPSENGLFGTIGAAQASGWCSGRPANLLGMSPSVQRTYTGFYLDAKGEDTRQRRLERIIARLDENKKPM
jgi:hypothetical protein